MFSKKFSGWPLPHDFLCNNSCLLAVSLVVCAGFSNTFHKIPKKSQLLFSSGWIMMARPVPIMRETVYVNL